MFSPHAEAQHEPPPKRAKLSQALQTDQSHTFEDLLPVLDAEVEQNRGRKTDTSSPAVPIPRQSPRSQSKFIVNGNHPPVAEYTNLEKTMLVQSAKKRRERKETSEGLGKTANARLGGADTIFGRHALDAQSVSNSVQNDDIEDSDGDSVQATKRSGQPGATGYRGSANPASARTRNDGPQRRQLLKEDQIPKASGTKSRYFTNSSNGGSSPGKRVVTPYPPGSAKKRLLDSQGECHNSERHKTGQQTAMASDSDEAEEDSLDPLALEPKRSSGMLRVVKSFPRTISNLLRPERLSSDSSAKADIQHTAFERGKSTVPTNRAHVTPRKAYCSFDIVYLNNQMEKWQQNSDEEPLRLQKYHPEEPFELYLGGQNLGANIIREDKISRVVYSTIGKKVLIGRHNDTTGALPPFLLLQIAEHQDSGRLVQALQGSNTSLTVLVRSW
jgi:hypothetical protein